jgi:hypothetical protein
MEWPVFWLMKSRLVSFIIDKQTSADPSAARSKALVCGHSLAETAGSNLTEYMDVCFPLSRASLPIVLCVCVCVCVFVCVLECDQVQQYPCTHAVSR